MLDTILGGAVRVCRSLFNPFHTLWPPPKTPFQHIPNSAAPPQNFHPFFLPLCGQEKAFIGDEIT